MNPILLNLRPFSLVKVPRRQEPHWLVSNSEPRWATQLRNMQLRSTQDKKQLAATAAYLSVEHGAEFDCSPNMWNAHFLEPTYLCKKQKHRMFRLDCEFQLDHRGNLHNDTNFALKSGDEQFYFLHGLQIDDPKWILTPAEELKPSDILAIPNADLRREMIRKKGIEQMLDGMFHRRLDQQGNYTLYQVLLGDDISSACNFLKMLNPSIGVWHMEGVPNEIRTVSDALRWRNQNWFEHAEDIT